MRAHVFARCACVRVRMYVRALCCAVLCVPQVGGDIDPSKVAGDEGGLVSNHAYSMLQVYVVHTAYLVRCTQSRRKSAAPTRQS